MVDPGIDANRPEDGPDAALSEAIERFGPLRLARLLFRRGRRD
jgi:hypothetical protein